MNPAWKTIPLVAFIVVLAFAATASALDLTGTYTGRLTCTGLDAAGDRVNESVSDTVLEVSQSGTDLLATIDALPYAGTLVESSRDPERRGVATLTACNNDGDDNGRVEAVRLVAKLSSDSNKLTVKLGSVRGTGGSLECSGSYRRVEEVDPEVSACPVLHSCVCVGLGGGDFGCGNGGVGGDRGDLHVDVSQAWRDDYYVNGNTTGWVCVAQ